MRDSFTDMSGVKPSFWGSVAAVGLAALMLVISDGCSRQPDLPVPEISASSGKDAPQRLPFTPGSDTENPVPLDSVVPGAGVPGRATIPAGIPITVRLLKPLSSASARVGETFVAMVDVPIQARRRTLVMQGAEVIGRVVAVKTSLSLADPGYLRLVLASIAIRGKRALVQSSSVFAKGHARATIPSGALAQKAPEGDLRSTSPGLADATLGVDAPLTFHLLAPVALR